MVEGKESISNGADSNFFESPQNRHLFLRDHDCKTLLKARMTTTHAAESSLQHSSEAALVQS